MKIEIMDFDQKKTTVELPDDFDYINVTVISGDEIISAYKNNEQITKDFDSSNTRVQDYYDDEYIVLKEDIHEWNKREDSYDGINHRSIYHI